MESKHNRIIQETIKREYFTSAEAADLCLDNGNYADFFETNYGLDCPIPDDVEDGYILKRKDFNVRVEVSSYRGMCAGAFHTYINVDIPGAQLVKQMPNGAERTLCGFISHKFNKLNYYERDKVKPSYNIEVCRRLSQKEIESDTIRWRHYKVGDRTNAFEKTADAIMQACNIMRARLATNWIIEVEEQFLHLFREQMPEWTIVAYDAK